MRTFDELCARRRLSMTRAKLLSWTMVVLYVFATVNAMQFYIVSTQPYLDVAKYYAGTERLPFQERIFPIPIMKALDHLTAAVPALRSGGGVLTQVRFSSFLLSLVSFGIASIFVVLLYRSISRTRALGALVAPIFLALTVATYVLRPVARLYYPYDMPALAFFAAGLFFIYQRKFFLLLIVLLVGTFNRETTLFLILIYLLDAASRHEPALTGSRAATFLDLDWRRVPWLRAACLTAVWVAIRAYLGHLFKGNDRSEDYNRVLENVHRLVPRFIPSIFDLCGYVLPIVYLRRKHLGSQRLAAWFLVVPVWIACMFVMGIITETRVYGELIPLVAVAATLLLEEKSALQSGQTRPVVELRPKSGLG